MTYTAALTIIGLLYVAEKFLAFLAYKYLIQPRFTEIIINQKTLANNDQIIAQRLDKE